jgi:hypothetical protein
MEKKQSVNSQFFAVMQHQVMFFLDKEMKMENITLISSLDPKMHVQKRNKNFYILILIK